MRKVGKAAGFIGVAVGVAIALVGDRGAKGDASTDAPPEGGGFDPFVLTDPGPDPTPYDQLTPDEQADIDSAAAESETNCGAAVQSALANATAQEAERARAEIAAREVGMEGAGQEGVVQP